MLRGENGALSIRYTAESLLPHLLAVWLRPNYFIFAALVSFWKIRGRNLCSPNI